MTNDRENKSVENQTELSQQKERGGLDRIRSAVHGVGKKLDEITNSAKESVRDVPIPEKLQDAGNRIQSGYDTVIGKKLREELEEFTSAVTTTIVGLHQEQKRIKNKTQKLIILVFVLSLAALGMSILAYLK